MEAGPPCYCLRTYARTHGNDDDRGVDEVVHDGEEQHGDGLRLQQDVIWRRWRCTITWGIKRNVDEVSADRW